MITPWDTFRYVFEGGCGLLFIIGGIMTMTWFFDHTRELLQTRISNLMKKKWEIEALECKVKQLEEKQK